MEKDHIEKADKLSKLRKRIIEKSEHSESDDSFGDCSLLTDIQEYQNLYFKE